MTQRQAVLISVLTSVSGGKSVLISVTSAAYALVHRQVTVHSPCESVKEVGYCTYCTATADWRFNGRTAAWWRDSVV